MKRFFGMMPSDEIEKEVIWIDDPESNFKETIQAGPNGWTIIWADGGSLYTDQTKGTEANYEEAVRYLKKHFPDAVELVK